MLPEEEIGSSLLAQSLTLATAESCTGGLLAHHITNVSGSSAYYRGGVVSYSNELKEALLGVQHQTLLVHGAVSEETAREMARGARSCLGADVAVSITGIAGPTGGTPDKPVGLVYIALSAPDAELCHRHLWHGDRLANKEQSVAAALKLLRSYLRDKQAAGPSPSGEGASQQAHQHHVGFVNEPVSVELHTRSDGSVLPLGFTWRSRHYQIESWGREGDALAGRRRHCYLVQTAGPETWELCQDTETAQWHLVRHWAASKRAV